MKKSTKRKILIADFRQENQCLRCGILCGERANCENCEHYNKCKICEIVMRNEQYTFYEYVYKMKGGLRFYEEYIRTYEPRSKESHVKGTCEDCLGFEERIANKCFCCGKKISNTRENFILRGNTCLACINVVNLNMNVLAEQTAESTLFSKFMSQTENWDEWVLGLSPKG